MCLSCALAYVTLWHANNHFAKLCLPQAYAIAPDASNHSHLNMQVRTSNCYCSLQMEELSLKRPSPKVRFCLRAFLRTCISVHVQFCVRTLLCKCISAYLH